MRPERKAWKAQAEAFVSNRNKLSWLMTVLFIAIITVGWLFPWFGYFVPLCMLGAILPAFVWGRRWCDWWCPRGSFLNQLLSPISMKKAIPGILRGLPFRLFMMGVLMTVFSIRIYQLWPDPLKIGGFFVMFLTITTTVGIVLGLAFKPRSWCAFCPVGTMAKWAGTNKYPLSITEECTECKACERVCPLGISAHAFKDSGIVADWDCLKCKLCVVSCPQQCLKIGERELHKAA